MCYGAALDAGRRPPLKPLRHRVEERGVLMMSELISVIVTTYNREDALDAVLRALGHQSDQNFEIVIADDGSSPDTARIIKSWASRLPVPVKHVRHEHDGFRGAEIRNRAIRVSAGRTCIFLDGDCLARADFVATHRQFGAPGWFVAGNRILLSRELTEDVLGKGVAVETWRVSALVCERLRGGVNRLLPALRLPLGPLRILRRNDWEGVKTCNLAVPAATSTVLTVSTVAIRVGVGRTPTSWCAFFMQACGARMEDSPPGCCICGITKPIGRVCRRMTVGLKKHSSAIVF
jgi:hypothetical protein